MECKNRRCQKMVTVRKSALAGEPLLTESEKECLVHDSLHGKPVSMLARENNISEATVYKYMKEYCKKRNLSYEEFMLQRKSSIPGGNKRNSKKITINDILSLQNSITGVIIFKSDSSKYVDVKELTDKEKSFVVNSFEIISRTKIEFYV